MYPPQGYQSNAPSFSTVNPLVVIHSKDEYERKGTEYINNKNNPRYRIVYFHEFRYGVSSGLETYDSAHDYELRKCIDQLSNSKDYSQWLVDNKFEYFSNQVFEITYKSGIIFFRDNLIVEILNGCSYEAFRLTLEQINVLPVKNSPKKNRLLMEAQKGGNKKQEKKRSDPVCIVM